MRPAHKAAIRSLFIPRSVGRSENPKPGSDGITRSNDTADGSFGSGTVRSGINPSISRNDPGQPCVMISAAL